MGLQKTQFLILSKETSYYETPKKKLKPGAWTTIVDNNTLSWKISSGKSDDIFASDENFPRRKIFPDELLISKVSKLTE